MSTMSTKADERSKVQGQNARTHESASERSTYEVKTWKAQWSNLVSEAPNQLKKKYVFTLPETWSSCWSVLAGAKGDSRAHWTPKYSGSREQASVPQFLAAVGPASADREQITWSRGKNNAVVIQQSNKNVCYASSTMATFLSHLYLFGEFVKASGVQFTHEMTFHGVTVHPKLLGEFVNHRWPVLVGGAGYCSCNVIIAVVSSEYWVRGLGQQWAYREGQGTSEKLETKCTALKSRFRKNRKKSEQTLV